MHKLSNKQRTHCAGSSGQCFIAGTLVWTDQGTRPIEEITVGDMVLSQPARTGEKAYRKVIKTVVADDVPIVVVKYTTSDENKPTVADEVLHLYTTVKHPFWVKRKRWTQLKSWTPAMGLRNGQQLHLAEGGTARVLKVWPVVRTPRPGFGWVGTEFIDVRDALESEAHIVDFRNGADLYKYLVFKPEEVSVPYVGGTGTLEGYYNGFDLCKIFEGNDPFFKTRVYNLEVEGFHTYYVGELGVWVHNGCGSINW